MPIVNTDLNRSYNMLETLAIAALVMGGVSTATIVTDDQAVADADRQTNTVEVQKQDQRETRQANAAENPFLD